MLDAKSWNNNPLVPDEFSVPRLEIKKLDSLGVLVVNNLFRCIKKVIIFINISNNTFKFYLLI